MKLNLFSEEGVKRQANTSAKVKYHHSGESIVFVYVASSGLPACPLNDRLHLQTHVHIHQADHRSLHSISVGNGSISEAPRLCYVIVLLSGHQTGCREDRRRNIGGASRHDGLRAAASQHIKLISQKSFQQSFKERNGLCVDLHWRLHSSKLPASDLRVT